jgi:catechol 2,3-dioxygenase-like lactoylglutathione lyase family enzyme
MDSGLLAKSRVHHVALRVVDAQASKSWLITMLDFEVENEFTFQDTDFIWIRPAQSKAPVIELIGGAEQISRPARENVSAVEEALARLKQPGFNHICLQVDDCEQAMAELRRRNVKVLLDVMAAPPGSGVKKCAFILDPWENIFELLEVASDSESD